MASNSESRRDFPASCLRSSTGSCGRSGSATESAPAASLARRGSNSVRFVVEAGREVAQPPLGGQEVAEAPLGEDQRRMVGVVFDLSAQVVDVALDVVDLLVVLGTPDALEQRLRGDRPAGLLRQGFQQAELLRGEMDRLPGPRPPARRGSG